ncbi:MAG: MCE family protein [Deltaproteobacteria bacterium]|nr:MCE family protein [Deltaproteobacteria bacterium]
MFEKVYTYTLSVKSGENLTTGMPVVFSGFTIGNVEDLELSEEGIVLIKIKIPKRHIKWIRSDSVFALDKPLIGSAKIIVQTKNLNSPELSADNILEIATSSDINEMVKRIHPILDTITKIATNIENITADLSNPQGDVHKILKNTQKLTANFSEKSSLLEMAVSDQDSVVALHAAMKNARGITVQIENTLKKVNAMAVKTDEKLYGDEGLLPLVNNILKDLVVKLQKLDATVGNINTISREAAGSAKDMEALREQIDATIYAIQELVDRLDNLVPFKKEPDMRLP